MARCLSQKGTEKPNKKPKTILSHLFLRFIGKLHFYKWVTSKGPSFNDVTGLGLIIL